jgi:polyisoprenoid-binding protein YceI
MKIAAPLSVLPVASLAAAFAAVAGADAGAAEITAVVPAKSSIGFVIREMNVPVSGRFGRFTAQVSFDPSRPEAAKVSIDVDTASIDAGSDEANDEVVGKGWLDVKDFPQAHFASSAFRALGGNRYEVSGRLTIKGRSQDVTAPFTFAPQGAGGTIDGSFTLKRADFSIGEGSWSDFSAVANEIQLKFHFVAGGAR